MLNPTFIVKNKWTNRANGSGSTICLYHLNPLVDSYSDGMFFFDTDDECRECLILAAHAEHPYKYRKALQDPRVAYTRFRTYDSRGFGKGYVSIYFKDSSSPTGVLQEIGIASEIHEEIYNELLATGKLSSRLSPLSPTEDLRTGH